MNQSEIEKALLRRLVEMIQPPTPPDPRADLISNLLQRKSPPAPKAKSLINVFAQRKPTTSNRLVSLKKFRAQQPKATSPFRLPIIPPKISPQLRLKFRASKPNVFVSFDWDNDRNYKHTLEMWNANKKFTFVFGDKTPKEIQSEDVGRIKAVLTTKVRSANHTVVLAGRYANTRHRDSVKIGCLNWIHFEVQQTIKFKKKLTIVLLPGGKVPSNAIGYKYVKVNSFNEADIVAALSE